MELDELVETFALGMKVADQKSGKPSLAERPEREQLDLVVAHSAFKSWSRDVPYFSLYAEDMLDDIARGAASPTERLCDLVSPGPDGWAVGTRLLMLLEPDGSPALKTLDALLSPYSDEDSALNQCRRLAWSSLTEERKALLLFGYEHKERPMAPAIEQFMQRVSKDITIVRSASSHVLDLSRYAAHVFGLEIGRPREKLDGEGRQSFSLGHVSAELRESTFDHMAMTDWIGSYSAIRRMADGASRISEVLYPLEVEVRSRGEIPGWAGVDLLRSYVSELERRDRHRAGGIQKTFKRPEFILAVDAIARHPDAAPSERPPLNNPGEIRRKALRWYQTQAWLQADVDDGTNCPPGAIWGDSTTYRIFGGNTSKGCELWVWSGPAETSGVLGMHGSDLRSQNRAKRLARYPSLDAARAAAQEFEDQRTK